MNELHLEDGEYLALHIFREVSIDLLQPAPVLNALSPTASGGYINQIAMMLICVLSVI